MSLFVQRDLVVASYGVLAAMGRLTASDIALEAEFTIQLATMAKSRMLGLNGALQLKARTVLASRACY